jgi:hypothetical protein
MKRISLPPPVLKWRNGDHGQSHSSHKPDRLAARPTPDDCLITCGVSNGQFALHSHAADRLSDALERPPVHFMIPSVRCNPHSPKRVIAVSSDGLIREWVMRNPGQSGQSPNCRTKCVPLTPHLTFRYLTPPGSASGPSMIHLPAAAADVHERGGAHEPYFFRWFSTISRICCLGVG